VRRLDFKDHRRDLDQNRYVYAVVSRRARGLSIGVNLNPDKVCNFDCPYCQVDRTTPGASPRIDVGVLASELEELLERARGDLWGQRPSTASRRSCAAWRTSRSPATASRRRRPSSPLPRAPLARRATGWLPACRCGC
jgi:hypothetical protein